MLKTSNQDDFRVVLITDETETYVELSAPDEFGIPRLIGKGVARRRKGEKRDENLGMTLALSRAFQEAAAVYSAEAERLLGTPGFKAKRKRR
ncbi:hypothetical protein [Streptomyces griseus]|uniref:hypothetical protein n=1 Tax=Streptomyces griseus TaxID=1911 RepID=UPI0033C77136